MSANNVIGSFEDSIEQGISLVSQQAKAQVASTVKTAATQTTGNTFVTQSSPQSDNLSQSLDTQGSTDQFNETGTQASQNKTQNLQDNAKALQEKKQLEQEDQVDREKKLKDTRQKLQQLHNQVYYDPTFKNRKKEQTVQDKIEREDQEKEQKQMVDFEEKKKKEPPIALHQAQTRAEINRGASG